MHKRTTVSRSVARKRSPTARTKYCPAGSPSPTRSVVGYWALIGPRRSTATSRPSTS